MKKRISKMSVTGMAFILPYVCLSAVFMIYPIIRGIRDSFYDYGFGAIEFVGLSNYAKVFTDDLYLMSIKNSMLCVVIVVPALIIFGLFIGGSIFDKSTKYMSFIRTCLYIPVIASMVVMSIIWRFILDPSTGLARYLSNLMGREPVSILGNGTHAMIMVLFLLFTMHLGQCVVLYVADMLGISTELIDALQIDGGNRYHLFRYLLIPLTKTTTIFNFITQTSGLIRVYAIIKLLTNGGPNNETTTMMFLLQQDGFRFGNFGSASALGIVMFIISLVLVMLRFAADRKRD